MEPGVPFALLGTVQLLAIAAWAALAGVAVALRPRRPGATAATGLAAAGGLVLAAAEVATAVGFGDGASDALSLVRVAGAVLLGAGLVSGAFSAAPQPAGPAAPLPGVVVPLAASPAPALVAALALAAAAVAAWVRLRRDAAGLLLSAGLGLAAMASAVSPLADDRETVAVAVVALRGLAAVAVLAGLVLMSRRSLLGKVVAAILAGVLAMAAAAVGVVGTVVVQSYDEQAAQLVREAADDRLAAVNRVVDQARAFVRIAAGACPERCDTALEQLISGSTTGDFVVGLARDGRVTSLGGRAPLTPSERLGLGRDAAVRGVFDSPVRINEVPTAVVRLVGSPPTLAVLAITVDRPSQPTRGTAYGVRLDNSYAANDVAAGAYGLSFLIDGRVVATNLSAQDAGVVARIAGEQDVASGVDTEGLTVAAQGSSPTVHYAPVSAPDGSPLGIIALSRDAGLALEAQRRALTFLLVTALLATALVGGLALLVGRRTVDPVRRLTAAAARVSAGDLEASAGVDSADEVGTLSRTFDTMTGSLLRLTDDLRSSGARLQTVLTSMSDGLVATDADGLVTSINPAALEMVGLTSPEAALGRPLVEVVDVRDLAGQSMVAGSRRLFDTAAEVHRSDDERLPVRVSLAPLDSGDGVVLVLRDTTREREVERMKTEFLSNVSHELKTPMTSISAYSHILANKPGLAGERVTEFATVMHSESIKMNRVVDLLVDVASIEAGRVTITPRPVNVRDFLDARVAAWEKRAPARAKDIKRRVAGGLPPVMVDPSWAGKALDEFVDNAVKYTPRGTSITLVAAMQGDAVRVGVKDAGPGIAEADQRLLFTSFEQVDGSATRRVGGLGLGLSFVQRLAEDAGWPLSFTSVVGKGSEFSLDLPVSDEPVPRAPRRASKAARPPVPARGRAR